MALIKLVDARRSLNLKCRELFRNEKIAESIYRFLCDGIEECDDATPDVPERKVGKWIDAKPGSGLIGKVCSCCGNEAYWDADYGQQLFDWCPRCGAEMEGEDDDQ